MKTERQFAANSDVYAQVEQVPMENAQRVKALATLQSADAFIDNIAWVANGIKHLFTYSADKSNTKNKLAA